MVGAPRVGDVVCHNDLSPDNTIYGGWREVWHDTHGQQWLGGLRYVEANRVVWERLSAG